MNYSSLQAEMEHLRSVSIQLHEEIAKLEDAQELGVLTKFSAARLGALVEKQAKLEKLEKRMSELEAQM